MQLRASFLRRDIYIYNARIEERFTLDFMYQKRFRQNPRVEEEKTHEECNMVLNLKS